MGTVGDPKLDLAWVPQAWQEDTSSGAGAASLDYVDVTGMPGTDELLTTSARETGRQVDDIDYYLVLARWKLGIVLEQGYTRALQGTGDNDKLLAFGPLVVDLIRRAADLAESTDYPRALCTMAARAVEARCSSTRSPPADLSPGRARPVKGRSGWSPCPSPPACRPGWSW